VTAVRASARARVCVCVCVCRASERASEHTCSYVFVRARVCVRAFVHVRACVRACVRVCAIELARDWYFSACVRCTSSSNTISMHHRPFLGGLRAKLKMR
jgi:hypothetical protein